MTNSSLTTSLISERYVKCAKYILIHSVDPQLRQVVVTIFTRPSVRFHLLKSRKTNKF